MRPIYFFKNGWNVILRLKKNMFKLWCNPILYLLCSVLLKHLRSPVTPPRPSFRLSNFSSNNQILLWKGQPQKSGVISPAVLMLAPRPLIWLFSSHLTSLTFKDLLKAMLKSWLLIPQHAISASDVNYLNCSCKSSAALKNQVQLPISWGVTD